jgi:hypothetical protein
VQVLTPPDQGSTIIDAMSATLTLLLTPASHHLLAHARSLADKEHGFAVVFAHAACELNTEEALIRLLASLNNQVLAQLLMPGDTETTSFANPRVLRVYCALTRDDPRKANWWQRWLDSRRDRHAVAHRGTQMTRAQADEAITVAEEYIKHVTEKVKAALEPTTP